MMLLSQYTAFRVPELLYGRGKHDDAAIYQLRAAGALAASVDVIGAVCDDATAFGEIAAANALSDIYAVGATPLLSLAVTFFPTQRIPLEIRAAVLKGGAAKSLEAGAPVVGGHTGEDTNLKYGLCVIGTVGDNNFLTNRGAKPGDVLLLTKPIGTGLFISALRQGVIAEQDARQPLDSMRQLNDRAAIAARRCAASAVTDVSGFGILGHAMGMALASDTSLRINAQDVHVFDGAMALAKQGIQTSLTKQNYAYVSENCDLHGTPPHVRVVLSDPQTSGGLLLAIPQSRVDDFTAELRVVGVAAHAIGEVIDRVGKPLQVVW